MESNFNCREFSVKEGILKSNFEVAADSEFSLADYCPPIKKVLCYKISPAISSKNVTGNMVNFDGVAGVSVVYLDDEDNLCSYENSFVFSKNIECEEELKASKIKCSVSAEKITLRVVSERKIQLRGDFELEVNIEKISKKKFLCCDSLRDCEVKSCKIPVKENIIYGDKSIIIEDDIELSDSHAEIDRILNCTGKIIPDMSKIMNGKVMVKGSLEVKICYLSTEGMRAYNIIEKIPYSQVIELEGVSEDYTVATEEQLVFLEVKCRKGGYEEQRTLIVNAKICVTAEASLDKTEEVILDMFSTCSEIALEVDGIRSKQLADKVNESFSVKKSLEFSEGTVGSILNLSADVATNGIKNNDDSITVYGTAYIKLLLCDTSGIPQYFERTVDFEYKYPISRQLINPYVETKIALSNLSYIITSDASLDIMCELCVQLSIYEITDRQIVSGATIVDSAMCDDGCSIYVCYTDKETDIWDLAKKYKSSVREISAINRIEGNIEKVSGVLVIPSK